MMGYPFDACLSMGKKEMGKKKRKKSFNHKVSAATSPILVPSPRLAVLLLREPQILQTAPDLYLW